MDHAIDIGEAFIYLRVDISLRDVDFLAIFGLAILNLEFDEIVGPNNEGRRLIVRHQECGGIVGITD
jgi:hypothetical protein